MRRERSRPERLAAFGSVESAVQRSGIGVPGRIDTHVGLSATLYDPVNDAYGLDGWNYVDDGFGCEMFA